MTDLPETLPGISRPEAVAAVGDPDLEAFTCVLALSTLLGDELFDDEEQPPGTAELRELLAADNLPFAEEALQKAAGLLHIVSGDEFLKEPVHFARMTAAVCEGDPFAADEDYEISAADAWWALYQAGLLVEDDLVEEIGPRVRAVLDDLATFDVEDVEEKELAFLNGEADESDTPGPLEKLLTFRTIKLAGELKKLGCPPRWLAEIDGTLAQHVAEA